MNGLFAAGPNPPPSHPIRVGEHTTARALACQVIFAARKLTLPAGALLICHQVCEALVPVVMGAAIDGAIAGRDGSALIWWIVVLGLLFGCLSFAFRFGSRIGFLAMNTVQHHLRSAVTDRILDPCGMSGPSRTPGMLLSIATSDVTRLAMMIVIGLYPVAQCAAVIFCGVVLLWISWPLGLAILLAAPLLLWLMDVVGGPLRRRSGHEQQLAGEAASAAADLMSGYRVLTGMGVQRNAAERYRLSSRRALAAVIRARRSEGVFLAVTEMSSSVLVIGVGIAGGWLALRGDLTVGQLITVVGLTQFVIAPLRQLGANLGVVWASGLASAERVRSVLAAGPAVTVGDRRVTEANGEPLEIRMNTGIFTVPPAGMTVITDPGVVSSATAVLSRSMPPSAEVTVGGADLFDYAHGEALRLVRVAPHSGDLFAGSVIDNIRAVCTADTAAVDRALLAAGCDDLADVLPEGLETDVGESGRMLSGGQRQRVALARALAAESRVLVLVEPTNAVDSVTEAAIAERIRELRSDAATVVFTASPAFVAAADTVVDTVTVGSSW